MKRCLRRLSSLFKQERPRRAARPTARPAVEGLEGRVVPTILFTPHFPGESLASNSVNVGLNSPKVYLILWGTGWNKTQYPQSYVWATQTFLNTPYLSKLTQYGSDGKATWGGSYVDDASDPSASFVPSNVQAEVQKVTDNPSSGIPHPSIFDPTPIYVVVTDVNATSGVSGAAGYNLSSTIQSPFFVGPNTIPVAVHLIWSSTIPDLPFGSGTLDNYTSILSHEVAESMSYPALSPGVQVNMPSGLPAALQPGGVAQICDGEPDGRRYGYRLDGVWVQPYWSQQDAAFVVPDGNSQNFVLTPIWNGNSFSGQYNLAVTGAGNSNDIITIDQRTDGAGSHLRATLDGATAEFDPGTIARVNVDAEGGSNTIQVAGLPKNVTLNVGNSSTASQDYVTVGSGGSVANVAGSVGVTNPNGSTYLTVDDSADRRGRTIAVYGGAVAVVGLTTVFYGSGVKSLTVNGGRGGNEVDVNSTAASIPVTIGAGSGYNTVNVRGASGSLSVSSLGHDRVTVGANGSLAGITGAVSVGNACVGQESLTIDASNDPARNVAITDHAVAFAGGPTISYASASSDSYGNTHGVTYLLVETGTGNKTITANSASPGTYVSVRGQPGDVVTGPAANQIHFWVPITVVSPGRGFGF